MLVEISLGEELWVKAVVKCRECGKTNYTVSVRSRSLLSDCLDSPNYQSKRMKRIAEAEMYRREHKYCMKCGSKL